MAIIGILAAIGLSSYGTVQSKARDARRKSDLENVARALEMYYNDKGVYPPTTGTGSFTWDNKWENAGAVYMEKTPIDKKYGYLYEPVVAASLNKGYRLYARLENLEDAKVPHNTITGKAEIFSTDAPADSETVCSQGCNYAVTSTNVSLTATETDD